MTPRPSTPAVVRLPWSALLAAVLAFASVLLIQPQTVQAAPAITAVAPAGGPVTGGTIVTITGSGFVATPTVTFGGTAATSVTFVSATSITATAPAHAAGAVDVVVTNPDTTAATRTNGYTFQSPPTIASISPTSGSTSGATTVTITGTGLLGATGVTFGGTLALSFTPTSSTTITATTPPRPGAGTVDVEVTSFAGSGSLVSGFTYTSSPTIAFISPASGPLAGSTSVSITGSGFVSGATVTFGGIPALSVTVAGGTQITAVTPPKASGAADVVVRNPDGQTVTLSAGFTYRSGPTITKVSPGIGPLLGGLVVTIEGGGYVPGLMVTMGGAPAIVSSFDAAKITVITPAHAAGTVSVLVTNADGQSATSVNGFMFADSPLVSGVVPSSGLADGGTKITISGFGFTAGASVTVGGTAAISVVVVGPTTITAVTPKGGKNGKVDIVVKSPLGLEGTGVGLFGYEGAAEPTPTATPGATPKPTSTKQPTTCTVTPGGEHYAKGRLNFVVVQSCTEVVEVVALAEKESSGKVSSVWYYDPTSDSWSFFLPSAGSGPLTSSLVKIAGPFVVLVVVLD